MKLGVYSHVGAMNQRRVYQHQAGQAWLYYYDWGSGQGANWMFGDGAGSEDRGIESVNLQARALAAQWCPEDVNVSKVILCLSPHSSQLNLSLQFPWKVWTSRGRWDDDTRLRVECFEPSRARACCEVVLVSSKGEAGKTFPHRMGVYTAHSTLSGRTVYKHVQHSVTVYNLQY